MESEYENSLILSSLGSTDIENVTYTNLQVGNDQTYQWVLGYHQKLLKNWVVKFESIFKGFLPLIV